MRDDLTNVYEDNCEEDEDVSTATMSLFERLYRKSFHEGGTVGNPYARAFDSTSIITRSDLEKLKGMADKGSSIAKQVLSVMEASFMKLPEVHLKLKIILIQLFNRRCGLKSRKDMKVLLSYIFFVLIPVPRLENICAEAETLLKQGIHLYPNNVHFYDLLTTVLHNNGDPKSSLHYSEEALRKGSSEKEEWNNKVKAAYLDFLHHTPQDHWQVPHVFYNLAHLHLPDDLTVRNALDHFTIITSIRESKRYYDLGKESENNIPPCFLTSEESTMKKTVENLLSYYSSLEEKNKLDVPCGHSGRETRKPKFLASIIEIKPYLNNPMRHQLILNHRKKLVEFKNSSGQSNFSSSSLFTNEKSHVTPITLKGINLSALCVYQKGILELMIIDDLYFDTESLSIQLVVEDDNGDVTRLSIYNIMRNDLTKKTFSFGCKISIANPGVIQDNYPDGEIYTLEIDSLSCVKYLAGVTNMCRFCGQANAPHSCSICKRARYCTKDCQKHDWKLLKHKLICSNAK
ncbi:unnamed protein product [Orchesella dallaii]|uniref:MYND-type domain-containing protein n=1 Tax=Orchesella dallaii TaxID=48710 RepID=A0ABP1RDQ6_9HEXA